MVCVAWRGPSALDRYSFTAVGVLLEYLTDTPVAPLQRDLVEVSWPLSPPFLSPPPPLSFNLFLPLSLPLSYLSLSLSLSFLPLFPSPPFFQSLSPSLTCSLITLCLFRLVIHFALRLTAVLWRILRRALGLSSLECPWRRSTLAKKSE